MTFPQDHLQTNRRVEEHSASSVALVALAMIAIAMGTLILSL
ncbi:MAG: hypothetical protein AAF412_02625 [Pseudomonadota bacterium]